MTPAELAAMKKVALAQIVEKYNNGDPEVLDHTPAEVASDLMEYTGPIEELLKRWRRESLEYAILDAADLCGESMDMSEREMNEVADFIEAHFRYELSEVVKEWQVAQRAANQKLVDEGSARAQREGCQMTRYDTVFRRRCGQPVVPGTENCEDHSD
jgi:hypothetical protein